MHGGEWSRFQRGEYGKVVVSGSKISAGKRGRNVEGGGKEYQTLRSKRADLATLTLKIFAHEAETLQLGRDTCRKNLKGGETPKCFELSWALLEKRGVVRKSGIFPPTYPVRGGSETAGRKRGKIFRMHTEVEL